MAREALTGTAHDQLRHKLRAGSLAEALLQPGAGTVLRSGDRKLTRDELRSEAARIAGGLQGLGVKPGDRVAVYAANSLDWVLAYLGVQRAGACSRYGAGRHATGWCTRFRSSIFTGWAWVSTARC